MAEILSDHAAGPSKSESRGGAARGTPRVGPVASAAAGGGCMKRLVAALLYLFPRDFRRSFGAEMLATFDDRWHDSAGWRVAIRTSADLLCAAVLLRFSERRSAPRRKGDSLMRLF